MRSIPLGSRIVSLHKTRKATSILLIMLIYLNILCCIHVYLFYPLGNAYKVMTLENGTYECLLPLSRENINVYVFEFAHCPLVIGNFNAYLTLKSFNVHLG